MKLLCINAAGCNSLNEVKRIRRLTRGLSAEITYFDVDRTQSHLGQVKSVLNLVRSQHWDLVYQEGSGIGAGAALVIAAWLWNQSFIVSAGDPSGNFFQVTRGAMLGRLFRIYEKLLYRSCTAFLGWTPYLTGAAIALGAKRGITIEGAVDSEVFRCCDESEKQTIRQDYGLLNRHLVCGVVGSLNWNEGKQYCYGLELIESLKCLQREDVSLLIVGDGTGRARLEAMVPDHLKDRVVFTGRLSETEVVRAMNAMDIGFVTQSLDCLGLYRLTTKLPEYLACGLGIAMSPIPGFYDYVQDAGWALPAHHPASCEFHQACAAWIDNLDWDEVKEKSEYSSRIAKERFDYEKVRPRFQGFLQTLNIA